MDCIICHNSNWTKADKLMTCTTCGYVSAHERYFSQNITDLYDSTYYEKGDYFDYKSEKFSLRKNFKNRLKIIRSYIKSGDLLEVGSAYGFFLEEAKKYFKVTGVELNKASVDFISSQQPNVSIFNDDFLKLDFDNKSFNAIVSLDTIEHVFNAEEFVKKCKQLLVKDGYLFLETGDIGALVPRIQKENWRLVHPPEHLNYFSQKSLVTLLKQNNFEVLEVRYVWFWRSALQTIYRLFPKASSTMPSLVRKLLEKISFPLNTGDLMFIVARAK